MSLKLGHAGPRVSGADGGDRPTIQSQPHVTMKFDPGDPRHPRPYCLPQAGRTARGVSPRVRVTAHRRIGPPRTTRFCRRPARQTPGHHIRNQESFPQPRRARRGFSSRRTGRFNMKKGARRRCPFSPIATFFRAPRDSKPPAPPAACPSSAKTSPSPNTTFSKPPRRARTRFC